MGVVGTPSRMTRVMSASLSPCFHSASTRLGPCPPCIVGPWQLAQSDAVQRGDVGRRLCGPGVEGQTKGRGDERPADDEQGNGDTHEGQRDHT